MNISQWRMKLQQWLSTDLRSRRRDTGSIRLNGFDVLENRVMLAGMITQVNHFNTWDGGIIRSTDVAGIAYYPPSGQLYLADSEINELPTIFNGDNIFATSLSGDQVFREIASNNTEPTGITYNEFDGYFYVTNDTGPRTVTRYDYNLNNPLLVISTKNDVASATDPEGITANPSNGDLYVADGNGGGLQVLVYTSNLQFKYSFSVASQMGDAEGIAYHPASNHLFVVDGGQDIIFEYTLSGTFVESYDFTHFSPAPKNPQGLTFAPTSNPNDPLSALALYIADGMKDNFADGQVFEAILGITVGNQPPTTSGIADIDVFADAQNTVINLFSAFDDLEDPDSALTFLIENKTNPSLFTSTLINGTLGTLTLDYAPATTGISDITVRATDTGTPGLFIETTFRVTVHVMNSPPTTSGIANRTVAEDAANSVVNLFAAFDDLDEPDSSLTYTVTSSTNPALFTATTINGVAGTLTLSYAPHANGVSVITVRATDHGFPVKFVETSFTVTVTAVNDTPIKTSGVVGDLSVVKNAPAITLGLTGLNYGPGGGTDENGQVLSYAVTFVPSSLGVILLSNGSTVVTPGAYTLAQIRGMQFTPNPGVFGGPGLFQFEVTDNGQTNGVNDFKTATGTILVRVLNGLSDPVIVESRVSASSDDAEEKPSRSMRLSTADLELTTDGTNQQIVGIRFNGLNLPPGATIQNAYVQFQVDEATVVPTSLMIFAQAADNPTTFTDTRGNISSRLRTAAAVPWVPVAWNVVGAAGPDQRTPNIAAVIQEIVNRPGWNIGNSLVIIVTGTGTRTAESFDGVASAAPLLHVEYLPENLFPTTTGIPNFNVNLGAPNTTIDLFSAFDDFEDSDAALTYTIESNTKPSLFNSAQINGTAGTLTLAYAPGITGFADIKIRATDTGTPPLFVETTFRVTVHPFNNGPTTSGIGNVTVAEDSVNTVINLFAAFDDLDEPDASLTYTTTSSSNPALFTATTINGVAGTLTLGYVAQANGSSVITVRATDHGFPVKFVETSFAVTVTAVNDSPILTSGVVGDQTVAKNSTATALGLSSLNYGPGGGTDENSQALSYAVTTVPTSLGVILLANGTTVVSPGPYTLTQIQGMQFRPNLNVTGGPSPFQFTVTDNGQTDGINDFKTVVEAIQITVIDSLPNPTIIESRVATSSDDAEEKPTGGIRLTSSDLELTTDGSSQQVVGMRFVSINIPAGASIDNAYIQFQVDQTDTIATALTIYAQAVDNATTFLNTNGNISTRTKTVASVPWSPPAWNTVGLAGPNQRTPNLAGLIQEIVNRPGWTGGNSLVFIITGTGTRTAEAFDGVASAAPLLHIEYLPQNLLRSTTGITNVDANVGAPNTFVGSASANGLASSPLKEKAAQGITSNLIPAAIDRVSLSLTGQKQEQLAAEHAEDMEGAIESLLDTNLKVKKGLVLTELNEDDSLLDPFRPD